MRLETGQKRFLGRWLDVPYVRRATKLLENELVQLGQHRALRYIEGGGRSTRKGRRLIGCLRKQYKTDLDEEDISGDLKEDARFIMTQNQGLGT
jgi:hypothetical protein